ncbi:MAG: 16S rRNA (guanine(527)-N(7))-methyltransferase RsmG [Pseudomonadota bacterium]
MSRGQFNTESLRDGCLQLGFEFTEDQLHHMLEHLRYMQVWNRKLNLTSIDSAEDMITHHVLDSLALRSWTKGDRLLDMGTGGGFPGMPLAIANPNSRWTLLDSRNRRIEFLRFVCGQLQLDNAELVTARLENYRPQAKFDTLVSRAFTSLAEMISLSRQLQHPGCRLLAMKGKHPQHEVSELESGLQDRARIEAVRVPNLDADRHVVIIDF